MMIDHMTLTVRDVKKTTAFYEKALAPLGYRALMKYQEFTGFGDKKPEFWIKPGKTPTQPMHIAFRATSREAVDAFHEAALRAGGTDEGKPGPRPHYHPDYYGAFVIDPDGHPVEAVCHSPPARAASGSGSGAANRAPKKAPKTAAKKKRASEKKPKRSR